MKEKEIIEEIKKMSEVEEPEFLKNYVFDIADQKELEDIQKKADANDKAQLAFDEKYKKAKDEYLKKLEEIGITIEEWDDYLGDYDSEHYRQLCFNGNEIKTFKNKFRGPEEMLIDLQENGTNEIENTINGVLGGLYGDKKVSKEDVLIEKKKLEEDIKTYDSGLINRLKAKISKKQNQENLLRLEIIKHYLSLRERQDMIEGLQKIDLKTMYENYENNREKDLEKANKTGYDWFERRQKQDKVDAARKIRIANAKDFELISLYKENEEAFKDERKTLIMIFDENVDKDFKDKFQDLSKAYDQSKKIAEKEGKDFNAMAPEEKFEYFEAAINVVEKNKQYGIDAEI